ncbi:MAG: hypothetical protein KGR98_01765, partial [Verrucomicrobia bacterium]|nr:hypothetical protein [Verrucomicrobiota bacterium]
ENYHNIPRAREIWEAGVRMLKQQVAAEPAGARNDFDNRFLLDQLESNLGQLEEQAGNFNAAIAHWRLAKTVSPSPAAIQKHIDELTQKPWIPPGSPFPR